MATIEPRVPSTHVTFNLYIDGVFIEETNSYDPSSYVPETRPGQTYIGLCTSDGTLVTTTINSTTTTIGFVYLYTKYEYNTVTVDGQYLADIANAIREKNGSSTTYKPREMASAISALSGGASIETSTVTIECTSSRYAVSYTSVDSSGNVIYKTDTNFAYPYTITCLKNSCVAISSSSVKVASTSGASLLFKESSHAYFGINDAVAEIEINFSNSGGSIL